MPAVGSVAPEDQSEKLPPSEKREVAPMRILTKQERAGRRQEREPVMRPLGAPAELQVLAPRPAEVVAQLQLALAKAACHNNRKTSRRPETSSDISGTPSAPLAEDSVGAEERSARPAAFRNVRRLTRSRGYRCRSSRRKYSARFLRSLVRQAYKCSGIPRLDIADFQPHRTGIAAKPFQRMFRGWASRW